MNQKEVTIIDYGVGNLFSIAQAVIYVGGTPVITSDKEVILKSNHLILPGVGAFGNAMDNLKDLDLVSPIVDYIASGKPLMGVCLGMQILFDESEEFGNNKGLGIIKGTIKKFPESAVNGQQVKIPQIAWNRIYKNKEEDWKASPLAQVEEGAFMYFVHSYFAAPEDPDTILSRSNYAGLDYCSAVKKDNVYAFQFHPEKSTTQGLAIYKEFINI